MDLLSVSELADVKGLAPMIQDPKALYFSPSGGTGFGMSLFMECKEAYRLRYIEGIEAAEPNIHQVFGKACHKIPECYWKGLPQEKAFDEALKVCGELGPPMLLPSKIRDKWLSLMDGLMESVEAYYEFHSEERGEIPISVVGDPTEYKPVCKDVHMLEQEFQYQMGRASFNGMSLDMWNNASKNGIPVFVTGRIDQYIGTTLRELKTAAEVGANWKHDYRNYLLRNWGIQVYYWYLCQRNWGASSNAQSGVGQVGVHTASGLKRNQLPDVPPNRIEVEVLVKPYRDKRPRMELFDITKEVVSYRERTAQQIEWICREMAEYHLKYASSSPWPMSNTACLNKYGPCPFLVGCNQGHEKAAEKGLYKIRVKV
jgi:PD-(D/E)XK nuclease superfamily